MRKPLKKYTDRELVKLFISGDETGFAELVHRHKGRIFTTIFLIVKDRGLAEDLFQDVMIKVVRMIRSGRYNEEGKFKPWVMRIARNLAIDHFRKAQRTPLQRENDEYDIFNLIPRADDNIEQKIIRDENARYIRGLIQKLPEKQREVLIMRQYGELSFKEIAKLTNVSINTALGRMRYALINLRKMIEEDRSKNYLYEQKIRQK